MSNTASHPDVVALRPFVPATDLAKSVRFYTDLGFTVRDLADGLAEITLGPFNFLLQHFQSAGFADNYMMQLLVNDLDAWWPRIEALDLATCYAVPPPSAPALQPWGLTVAYVIDPSGVLWHIVQQPA